MDATYNDDGTVSLTMTRAEAHVFAWGGKPEAANAVGWNARHAIVGTEDILDDDDYSAIMREVEAYEPKLDPDPAGGVVKILRCIVCHRVIEPGRARLYALTCHDHAGK